MESKIKQKFIFAARSSLLSQTQTQSVIDQLKEKFGDDFDFELKVLETKGDKILHQALWKVEGKDFFTQELDDLLLQQKVHGCVHSYKDLATTRPKEFRLAAVTKRMFPHDVLLMRKEDIIHKKVFKDKFVIGTSSPRRIFQAKNYLPKLMPEYMSINSSNIECKVLRGNVPTRIEKLLNPIHGFDAILLAYAGVERLSKLDQSYLPVEMMILPLSLFTPAPGQGSLAVEIHEKTPPILAQMLQSQHDEESFQSISLEKKLFSDFGGGCHLPMGIYVEQIDPSENQDIKIIHEQGELKQKNTLLINGNKPNFRPDKYLFVGMNLNKKGKSLEVLYDELIQKKSYTPQLDEYKNCQHLLITSPYVLEKLVQQNNYHYFSAGVKTWEKSAKRNFWIHYCLDSKGKVEKNIKNILESHFYKRIYPQVNKDSFLSLSANGVENSIPCYDRIINENVLNTSWSNKIKECKHFFWGSYFQYMTYLKYFPHLQEPIVHHSCGLGKTLDQFRLHGIEISPLIDIVDYL